MQNIVILAGNIGQAPETRATQGQTTITHFTLATSRPRYSDDKATGSRTPNGTASPPSTASARPSSNIARRV